MKFGYRDRIILLIVCVVIILGVGIFVFIKPKWEKLSANQKKLESAQSTWEAKLLDFDRIPAKQENINKKFEQSKEVVKEFTPVMSSVELDEFLQAKFMNTEKFIEDKVTLKSALQVSDQQTTSLGYYYLTPSIVTYPLYEYADLDGSLAEAAQEKLHDSKVIASRTTQTVGVGHATFAVLVQREDMMTLIDAVNEYATKNHDAMMITSIGIEDYAFNPNPEEEAAKAPQVDEDGNPIQAAEEEDDSMYYGYTRVTINYEVYYCQEPTKPEVGPAYDKTIWDGDAWRNAAAE